ncbi:unnamed protein product [Prorocentrum cordatum]|uniref:Uncharacterized protein n=1 Tax=Prorocentrum cordatum TaxID=2364126 RepID=A0ABN9XTN0_9DINO|nr:unnamed protein product [Polarella glacialis]
MSILQAVVMDTPPPRTVADSAAAVIGCRRHRGARVRSRFGSVFLLALGALPLRPWWRPRGHRGPAQHAAGRGDTHRTVCSLSASSPGGERKPDFLTTPFFFMFLRRFPNDEYACTVFCPPDLLAQLWLHEKPTLAAYLFRTGWTAGALHRAGFSAAVLVDGGLPTSALVEPESGVPVRELLLARVDVEELLQAGCSVLRLVEARAPTIELLNAGAKGSELARAGVAVSELLREGAEVRQLVNEQISVRDLLSAGVDPSWTAPTVQLEEH